MATLQVDAKIINQLIQSGRIKELVEQIEGIDPNLANRLENETKRLLETPVEQFKNLQGAGGSVMQGMWIALWQGLWTVVEPILPAMFNYFGQLDAVRQLANQKAYKELRPVPNDIGTVLRFLHRMPDERESALENLEVQGYSSERIRQILISGREILNENTIAELWRRKDYTSQEAKNALQALGYFEDDAERLQSIWTTLLDAGTIRNLYLRGEIDLEDVIKRLHNLGYNQSDAEKITKLFFFIPPTQDLITMAVREVFTPDVAERFGQYEDFPEEFAEYAAQQGVSREWAKRYWAAHWELPSIQMGFEMYHRRVIDFDDLNLLMRSKDIMPFWRDKLLEISFNPLTRVDVRRMHAMGIIDRDGVKNAYLDIGYNENNADLMTDFTLAYNSRNERDLSKTEIVKSYTEGLIKQQEAIEMLFDMGYDEQETAIILTLADIAVQDKIKKARIKVIKNRFVKDVINEAQMNQELQGLDLTAKELELYIEEFKIAKVDKAEELTLIDLKAAFKRRIIREDEFKDILKERGYKERDIDILTKLVSQGG